MKTKLLSAVMLFTLCCGSFAPVAARGGGWRLERDRAAATGATAGTQAAAAPKAKGLEICPDPSAPCHSRARKFAAYELPFRLPARLTAGRRYKSAPFYAVIVKTYEEEACDADDHTASIERERLGLQKTHPARKVFASYSCPNMDAVDYDFPGKLDATGERFLITTFIAVYAGQTDAEAKDLLSKLQTRFPQAVAKRMTAGYEIMNQ